MKRARISQRRSTHRLPVGTRADRIGQRHRRIRKQGIHRNDAVPRFAKNPQCAIPTLGDYAAKLHKAAVMSKNMPR
jgi:hypothetical protein